MMKRVKKILLVLCCCVLLSWAIIAIATISTVYAVKFHRFEKAQLAATVAESILHLYQPVGKYSNGLYPLLQAFLNLSQETTFFATQKTEFQQLVQLEGSFSPEQRRELQQHLTIISENLTLIQQQQGTFFYTLVDNRFTTFTAHKANLPEVIQASSNFFDFTQQLLALWSEKSAQQENTAVLVLFQNNRELRPTGGFLGSYGLLTLQADGSIDWEVQDIYVPDGQIKGHVNPPAPIQEAFRQGFWRLRDANWHPDFPSAAERIAWFFNEGTGVLPDLVVGLNYETFVHFLSAVEPIYLPDEQEQLTSATAYEYLQRTTDQEFFAGSTLKKDTLASVNTALKQKLASVEPSVGLQLINIFNQEVNSKGIIFSSSNEKLQQWFECQHWSGSLVNRGCNQEKTSEAVFAINEANLGVSKANCCVTRQVYWNFQDAQVQLEIEYGHLEIPQELATVAGDYKAFVRVYVPTELALQTLSINSLAYPDFIATSQAHGWFSPETQAQLKTDQVLGLREIGFWVYVSKNQPTAVQLTFDRNETKQTQLRFVKQPGTLPFFNPIKIISQEQTLFEGEMSKDIVLTLN